MFFTHGFMDKFIFQHFLPPFTWMLLLFFKLWSYPSQHSPHVKLPRILLMSFIRICEHDFYYLYIIVQRWIFKYIFTKPLLNCDSHLNEFVCYWWDKYFQFQHISITELQSKQVIPGCFFLWVYNLFTFLAFFHSVRLTLLAFLSELVHKLANYQKDTNWLWSRGKHQLGKSRNVTWI